MIRVRPGLALVAALGAAAACAQAGGKSTGGELTPAGEQAATPPVFIEAVDASGICGTGQGSTFTDLYRDIFASTQPGGCSYQVSCHGNAGADGAQDQAGLQCYPDQHACRQSLLERNLVVPSQPALGVLLAPHGILRTPANPAAGEPLMPKSPAKYVMPQSCVDRIVAWINAGAPDN